jgi:predicted glycosyltransferase
MHRINFRLADKVMLPEAIPFESLAPLGLDRRRYRPYAGLKEQVTLADLVPDEGVADELGLDRSRPIAVLRPPATMSLYHRRLRNTLFDAVLERLLDDGIQVVMLPRTSEQGAVFADMPGVIVPASPVDGPSLLWLADAVVSAGGTMNREAALLGVPTWTTFAGELGAVDRWLVAQGRLRVAETADDVVVVKRRPAPPDLEGIADAVADEILRR